MVTPHVEVAGGPDFREVLRASVDSKLRAGISRAQQCRDLHVPVDYLYIWLRGGLYPGLEAFWRHAGDYYDLPGEWIVVWQQRATERRNSGLLARLGLYEKPMVDCIEPHCQRQIRESDRRNGLLRCPKHARPGRSRQRAARNPGMRYVDKVLDEMRRSRHWLRKQAGLAEGLLSNAAGKQVWYPKRQTVERIAPVLNIAPEAILVEAGGAWEDGLYRAAAAPRPPGRGWGDLTPEGRDARVTAMLVANQRPTAKARKSLSIYIRYNPNPTSRQLRAWLADHIRRYGMTEQEVFAAWRPILRKHGIRPPPPPSRTGRVAPRSKAEAIRRLRRQGHSPQEIARQGYDPDYVRWTLWRDRTHQR